MSNQTEYKKQQPQPGIVEFNDEQMEEVASGCGPWRTPAMSPSGFDPGMLPSGFGSGMGDGTDDES